MRPGLALALGVGAVLPAFPGTFPREVPEHVLKMAPNERAAAYPAVEVAHGPLTDVMPTRDGVLLVETHGVSRLDAAGRPVWRVAFEDGVRQAVAPASGAWIAGLSGSIGAGKQRQSSIWAIDAADGRTRVLETTRHPMTERKVAALLLAWNPLPFDPQQEESEPAPPAAGPAAALVPMPPEPVAGELGYRTFGLSDLLLEEGLFVLRTTRFLKSGRSWWSLHHFAPGTGRGRKLCDGTPWPAGERISNLRPHPDEPELLLFDAGDEGGGPDRSYVLDPARGRIEPAGELTEAPPERGVAVDEAYQFEPDPSGIVLVHPEGRTVAAVADSAVERVVRVPGTTVVFALGADRKLGPVADDVDRPLYRVDLGAAEASLGTHRQAREFQARVNEALELLDGLRTAPLAEASKGYERILELLGEPGPTPAQDAEAGTVLERARAVFAPRLAAAGKKAEARELVKDPPGPGSAILLLRLDAEIAPHRLRDDAEMVERRARGWTEPAQTGEALARAWLALKEPERVLAALRRIPAPRPGPPPGPPPGPGKPPQGPALWAGLAIKAAEEASRAGQPALAERGLAQAFEFVREPGTALRLAKLKERRGALGEAMVLLSDSADLDPEGGVGGIRHALAEAARASGDLRRARAVLDGLRLDQPLEPRYLELEADLLMDEGRPAEAEARLRALARAEPQNAAVKKKLADATAAAAGAGGPR